MARLNPHTEINDERAASSTMPSPTPSQEADDENWEQRGDLRGKKRKSSSMSASGVPNSASTNKRQTLEERSNLLPSQAAHRRELDARVDKQFYDPEQDEEERKKNKREMRDLAKALNDSRAEYLQPKNKGIVKTLETADHLFRNVKQTSDATIDSRLLVNAADLSYKKINDLVLGDSSIGIDVDDFVSKCIRFMKRSEHGRHGRDRSESPHRANTQNRRRGREIDEDDEEEVGDALNWDFFGRRACFLHNSRPCSSGFLLGPLSVQKKTRQPVQRKAREARANPANATRPLALEGADLSKTETANLTEICSEIGNLLEKTVEDGYEKAEEAFRMRGDVSDMERQELVRSYGMADNGGVPLFDFCVNPKSFGQTVENMFYVSFLIKEGRVGLEFDSQEMPTLNVPPPGKSLAERQETPRNQAVFTLDFDTFDELVKHCGIEKSIIPHREEEGFDDGVGRGQGIGSWYE